MKKDYMTRLERAARWRLPPREAEDVIADYRDIVGDPPRSDEELLRDLGHPRDAIRPLVQKKPYYTWLAVFVLMAACLLIPADSPLPGGLYPIWFSLFPREIFGFSFSRLFLLAGAAAALIWFRPVRGERKPPLPRAILIALAALAVVTGLVWWVLWQIALFPEGALANPVFHLPVDFWWPMGGIYIGGNLLSFLLEWVGVPLAVLGMTALVKARTRDRRWRAVYILSLSAILLAYAVLALLIGMDPTAERDAELARTRWTCVEITLIGLAGAGVGLC